MVVVGEPVPEDEVLLAYAQSEMLSRRWSQGLGIELKQMFLERVRYSPVEEWTTEDRANLLAAVRAFRPPLLDPVLRLGARWFSATLAASELPQLRLPPSEELRGLAPDRQLSSLVASLEKGRDTPDAEFSGGYRHMKNAYAPGRMHGRPCLVSKVPEGPYTVVEGLSRLAVLLWRAQSLKPVPDQLPVLLGTTERLDEWTDTPGPPDPNVSTATPRAG
jgi:hypothetical protein